MRVREIRPCVTQKAVINSTRERKKERETCVCCVYKSKQAQKERVLVDVELFWSRPEHSLSLPKVKTEAPPKAATFSAFIYAPRFACYYIFSPPTRRQMLAKATTNKSKERKQKVRPQQRQETDEKAFC